MNIEFNFKAKEPNICQFAIEGSQNDLITALTNIYKIPEGKQFVSRILEASQTAYFKNEQSN